MTSQKVLHAAASTDEERRDWVEKIRANIRRSRPLDQDPIAAAAELLVTGMAAAEMYPNFTGEPMLYEVNLAEKKPLGITLAQHGEWAIVRLSHEATLGIGVGSALASVNGVDCQLGSYADTVSMLKGWRPAEDKPQRRAPSYCGFLWKQSRGQRVTSRILPGAMKSQWKMRFFVLQDGVLEYFTGDPMGQVKVTSSQGLVGGSGTGSRRASQEETGDGDGAFGEDAQVDRIERLLLCPPRKRQRDERERETPELHYFLPSRRLSCSSCSPWQSMQSRPRGR